MKFKRDKWTAFVVALAATVAILAAGQLLWHKFAVAGPLDAGLKGIAGVRAVAREEDKSGGVTIKVTLAGVDNLVETYGRIEETVRRSLGRRPCRIVLADSRTPELAAFYHRVHYYIQEAVFTGGFSAMADRIQAEARAAGVDAKVWVDADRVYLALARREAALYVVVPRAAASQEVK